MKIPLSTSSRPLLRDLNIQNPRQSGKGTTATATIASKTNAGFMLAGGSLDQVPLSAFMIMIKTAPSNWPPTQQVVDVISGETGNVMSTRYSSATGSREKDTAPRIEQIAYGAATDLVCGAQMSATYYRKLAPRIKPAKLWKA